MPKYKHDEKEFMLRINWGGTQYRTTIPKILIERIKETKKPIYGNFKMNVKSLELTISTKTEKEE